MDTKLKNNHHYFLTSDHDESEFFQFDFECRGEKYKFTSCNDVFSKNEIDYGSQVLINTIIDNAKNYNGRILDICCGYGTIGIILNRFLDAKFDMCDINSFAVKLAKINIDNNNVVIENIFVSDMWENVDKKYNHIFSNPPIKVGKQTLLNFINGLDEHLENNGTVTIVIKKNLGADSTRKYLKEIFGNCEVLKRDKGYYILQSIKM